MNSMALWMIGGRHDIFVVRLMAEREIKMQKNLYICFIDNTKVFHKLRHKILMQMLNDLDSDGKDLTLVQDLDWRQRAAIKMSNDLSTYTEIKRGVRQEFLLSSNLFLLRTEIAMREVRDTEGIKVDGENINNIRYVEETVIIADSESKLQGIVDKIVTESEKFGLSLNVKKTYCMAISKKKDAPKCQLIVNGQTIKQLKQFVI